MSRPIARWIALIVGLAIGLAFGLVYTWLVNPVELINTYPALLRADYRQDWIRLVALSYVTDGDLVQARSRLEGLNEQEVTEGVTVLIEEGASAGYAAGTLRRLTALADALGVYTPAMLVYLDPPTRPPLPTHTPTQLPSPTFTPSPTPSPTLSPTPTSTPTKTPIPTALSPLSTPTVRPTTTPLPPTPTSVPGPAFAVVERKRMCEQDQAPHIEVLVRDESGEELAGVEIWLLWAGGADRAVSGLKPEYGAGYADFNAEADVSYTLAIGELGMPLVTGLQIRPCPADDGGEALLASWRVVIEHQSVEDE